MVERRPRSMVGPPAIQPRQGHLGHGNRGARRGVRRHRHLALVHRADLPCRSGRAWQRRPRGRARHAVAGLLVDYADHYRQICAHRHAHRQQWRRRHLRTVLVDSQVRRMACDSRHARRRGIPCGFGTYPGGFHQFRSRRLADPAAIGRVVRRKPKPDPDDYRRDHRDSLLRAVARHRKHRQSIRLDGAGLVRLPRHRGRHESL